MWEGIVRKRLSPVWKGGLVIIVYFFFPPSHPRLGSGGLGRGGKGQRISHKDMQTRLDWAEWGWEKGNGTGLTGQGEEGGGQPGERVSLGQSPLHPALHLDSCCYTGRPGTGPLCSSWAYTWPLRIDRQLLKNGHLARQVPVISLTPARSRDTSSSLKANVKSPPDSGPHVAVVACLPSINRMPQEPLVDRT